MMKDLGNYKKSIIDEVNQFKQDINPTMSNSPMQAKERIDQFLVVLPKVEKHIDEYCKKYFEDDTCNENEMIELKTINIEVYQDFINYCKIPSLSEKDL